MTVKAIDSCTANKIQRLMICVALTLLSVCQQSIVTEYQKNQQNDVQGELNYEQWVAAIGQDKTDTLLAYSNLSELNLLSMGAGSQNIIFLLNNIADIDKVAELLGNDYSGTGLGAVRLTMLLNRVDFFLRSPNRDYDGSALPDTDTLQRIVTLVNGISSTSDVRDKIVGLINAMAISRNPVGLTQITEARAKTDKIAKIVAHLNQVNRLVEIINHLPAATITNQLKDVLLGVNDSRFLVDVINNVSHSSRLIWLLQRTDTEAAALLAHLLNNVTTNVGGYDRKIKISNLLNLLENAGDWSALGGGQPNGIQTFTEIAAGSSHSTGSGFPRLINLLNSLNDPNDGARLAYLLNGLSDSQRLVYLLQDLTEINDLANSNNNGLIQLISEPGTSTTGLDRLIYLLNTIDIQQFFRIRNIVNGKRLYAGTELQQTAYRISLIEIINSLPQAHEEKLLQTLVGLTISGSPNGFRTLVEAIFATSPHKLRSIVEQVNSSAYLSTLLNGILLFNDLNTVINGVTLANIGRLATIVNDTGNASALPKLLSVLNNTGNANLFKINALINDLSDPVPGRIASLIINVSDVAKITTLVSDTTTIAKLYAVLRDTGIVANVDTTNLVLLLNGVTDATKLVAAINALATIADADKLVPLINNIAPLSIAFLINSIPSAAKIGILLNTVNFSKITSLVILLNDVANSGQTHTFNNTTGSRFLSTGLGRLVNIIENVPDLPTLTLAINTLTNVNSDNAETLRLSAIVREVNSSTLTSLLKDVHQVTYTSGSDLASLINALTESPAVPANMKVVHLLNTVDQCLAACELVSGTNSISDLTLIAQLIGTKNNQSQGVGFDAIATLVNSLNSPTAADRLAEILKNTSSSLTNQGATISRREGFVRILNTTPGFGSVYSPGSVQFPGIGPLHIATMINNAADAADVYSLINTNDIIDLLVLVGCLDRVTNPNFNPACTATNTGIGW